MPKPNATKSTSLQNVEAVLICIRDAWLDCCSDYEAERLNSEGCLQAAFYSHFRKASRDAFTVYVAVKVAVPADKTDAAKTEAKKRHVFVDAVICSDSEVLVSVELKYTPRAKPGLSGLKKDIKTLSQMRNQLVDRKRFSLEIQRRTSAIKTYKVSPHARMILGIFVSEGVRDSFDASFWKDHKPTVVGERWTDRVGKLPPKLGICFAFADEGNVAEEAFVGKSFDFAQPKRSSALKSKH